MTHGLTRATALWIGAALLISAGCSGEGDGEAPRDADANANAGEAAGQGETRVFVDDLGREVRLADDPERIVAGASFAVEYLAALDHRPVLRPNVPLAGVGELAGEIESIPTLAIDHSVGPNIEQIVAAEPDLVVLSPTFARFADTIEGAADAAVVIFRIDALADVPAKAEAFGELIGDPVAGEALAEDLERRVRTIEPPGGLADGEGPTVFAMFGTPASFFAFLPESYLGSMVERLGGRMVSGGTAASATSSQLAPFSFEALIAADPDVILMVHHGPAGEMADALADRASWSDLGAVESGRVHRVSERLFMTNPGPSAVRALSELRGLLYPDAVEPGEGAGG